MKKISKNRMFLMLMLLIGCLVSVLVLCRIWTTVDFHAGSINYINEKLRMF